MIYQNPKIPEGINVSESHPLKDFVVMLTAVSGLTALVLVFLLLTAEWLVKFIPFDLEVELAQHIFGKSEYFSTARSEKQNYVASLVEQLSAHQQLPDGFVITVHYVEQDTVNAYATLGGHIVVFEGLLDKLGSENALAMVLAHEIAHIKNRDPIATLGRGMTVGLALASIAGLGNSPMSTSLLSPINFLTAMAFSRDQEQLADEEALETVIAYYGHAEGAEQLFEVLQADGHYEMPEFFSSHPMTKERITYIQRIQKQYNGYHHLTPLPTFKLQSEKRSINE
jgi:predicted Zn-dependent protease